MTVRIYIPRDAAPLRLARKRWWRRWPRRSPHAGSTHDRSQRLARHALAGAAGRSGNAAGRVAYGPVKARDVASLLDAGLIRVAAHPLCSARPRNSVSQATDPAYLCPLRRHRSSLARRLSRPSGLLGLERAIAMPTGGDRCRGHESGLRGRGGRASRPASNGRPS